MKNFEDSIDAGVILLVLIMVMLWCWFLAGCNSKEYFGLRPSDTELCSHPITGHGPNPFDD